MYTFNFLTFYILHFSFYFFLTVLHKYLYCVVNVLGLITCFISVLNIFYLHHVLYLYQVIYIPVYSKLLPFSSKSVMSAGLTQNSLKNYT